MNGDGYPDLVVANGGAHIEQGRAPGIKVFLNDGQGHFSTTPIAFAQTLYVRDLRVMDFNEDGLPDLIITEEETGSLVLLVNQNLTFVETARFSGKALPIGAPSQMTVGDFNGDHHGDIAMLVDSTLIVLVGDGHANFTSVNFTEAAGVSGPLVSGDLDGDGRDDLVETDPGQKQLVFRRGSAASTLADPKRSRTFQQQPDFVLLGDFDGDGKVDVLVQQGQRLALEVLYAAASSSSSPVLQTYPRYGRLVAADFTGDGRDDLVTHSTFDISVGTLSPAHLIGALQPSVFAMENGGTSSIAAADFNGDGMKDVVVANASDVAILLNRGGGQLAAPPHIGIFGIQAATDVNGDGIRDLITASQIYLGNSDGSFTAGNILPGGSGSVVKVADLNADGNLDLVILDPTFAHSGGVMLGDGHGHFTNTALGTEAHRPRSIWVGDLDGDGKLDIVVGNTRDLFQVTIRYGRGDGTFESPVDLSGPLPSGLLLMRVGDLNGDGRPDIVTSDPYQPTVFMNLGNRKFASKPMVQGPSDTFELVDVDGDGKADLIEAQLFYDFFLHHVNVNTRISRGDGTFAPPLVFELPLNHISSFELADMNGDGKLDAVINDVGISDSTNTVAVLFEGPNGRFTNYLQWLTNSDLHILDFDGDGRLDLINGDVLRLSTCLDSPPRHRSAGR